MTAGMIDGCNNVATTVTLRVQSVQTILQHNIQSVSTPIPLLHRVFNNGTIRLFYYKNSGICCITIRHYTQPITATSKSGEDGGVAIITHRNVKRVHLKEYEVDGLQAVWDDVMVGKIRMVIGSVYIPPGNDDDVEYR